MGARKTSGPADILLRFDGEPQVVGRNPRWNHVQACLPFTRRQAEQLREFHKDRAVQVYRLVAVSWEELSADCADAELHHEEHEETCEGVKG